MVHATKKTREDNWLISAVTASGGPTIDPRAENNNTGRNTKFSKSLDARIPTDSALKVQLKRREQINKTRSQNIFDIARKMNTKEIAIDKFLGFRATGGAAAGGGEGAAIILVLPFPE